ncbi:MAG: hypothetical protein KF683_22460 [Rubrivivax sp.]|nr:hypothetical protein [Rubrivivax sp.]
MTGAAARLFAAWRAWRAEFGPRTVWLYAVAYALARLSRGWARIVPYAFVAQPIGSPALAAVRDDANTAIRLASPSDAALASEFPRPAAAIRQRFESGARCHVAHVKGRFAGYIWTRRGGYDEDEVRCRYQLADPASTVWDFDVYVDPAFRLGRTLARLWKAVDRDLHREGIRWSVSRISLFNPGSLAAHKRLGAQHLSTGVFILFGRLQLSLFSCRPFIHLGLRSPARPTLVLRVPAGTPEPGSTAHAARTHGSEGA